MTVVRKGLQEPRFLSLFLFLDEIFPGVLGYRSSCKKIGVNIERVELLFLFLPREARRNDLIRICRAITLGRWVFNATEIKNRGDNLQFIEPTVLSIVSNVNRHVGYKQDRSSNESKVVVRCDSISVESRSIKLEESSREKNNGERNRTSVYRGGQKEKKGNH